MEEEQAGFVKSIPFLLEDAIAEKGGKFEKASEPWAVSALPAIEELTLTSYQPHVVVSGILITGQNPASAKDIGEALLKALKT